MAKIREQMTVDNKLCLQISTGTDAYDVAKLLEFAPEQTEHCYYELYVQLHDLVEFYIDDYRPQDDINNWYEILYDFIAQKETKKLFQDKHLNFDYKSLSMLSDIINEDLGQVISKATENQENLYIKCINNIFEKHDNITESFVKYMCKKYNSSLRLIENGKVYNYEIN